MYIFMGLVILTFADVLLRYVIGSPISGSIRNHRNAHVRGAVFLRGLYWRARAISMDIVTGKLSELNKNRLGAITGAEPCGRLFLHNVHGQVRHDHHRHHIGMEHVLQAVHLVRRVRMRPVGAPAMLSHLLDQLAATIRGGGMGRLS